MQAAGHYRELGFLRSLASRRNPQKATELSRNLRRFEQTEYQNWSAARAASARVGEGGSDVGVPQAPLGSTRNGF
jgi:hypothetical protein